MTRKSFDRLCIEIEALRKEIAELYSHHENSRLLPFDWKDYEIYISDLDNKVEGILKVVHILQRSLEDL